MFEFSMTDVLNELEGMSVKEKLMKWISFHRKLRDFSLEVFEVQTELEKEYTEQIKRPLEHSITQLIREQNLEDVLQVGKDLYENKIIFDGHTYTLSVLECGGDWYLLLGVEEKNIKAHNNLLEKFADHCGLPYKRSKRVIEHSVEESELFEQIKSILLKIKG